MKTPLASRITTTLVPKATIDYDTYRKVHYLVEQAPKECQWYHRVSVDRSGGSPVYHLHDIFIPPQRVGRKDVETSPEELKQMWDQYKDRTDEATMKQGMKETKAWCHSHVDMKVEPSDQDEANWKDWIKSTVPVSRPDSKIKVIIDQTTIDNHPPMMTIVNKSDEWFVRVYDPVLKIQFDSVPVSVVGQPTYPEIDAAIAAFGVYEEKKPAPTVTTSGPASTTNKGWSAMNWTDKDEENFYRRYTAQNIKPNPFISPTTPSSGTSLADIGRKPGLPVVGDQKKTGASKSNDNVLKHYIKEDYPVWTEDTLNSVTNMFRSATDSNVFARVANYLKLNLGEYKIALKHILNDKVQFLIPAIKEHREADQVTQYRENITVNALLVNRLNDFSPEWWTVMTDIICNFLRGLNNDENQVEIYNELQQQITVYS